MIHPVATRTCTFLLDPRGFVRATMHQGVEMDLDDARDALRTTTQVSGGQRVPVLVDSRRLKSQSREARQEFASDEAVRVCSAVALLVDSPVSRIIANFFLRQQVQRTPTRLFTDETAAVEWLLGQPR
ncbi:MAG: STAS/SEC14 domain-containing protein [Myxococcota bacterium]|nr:STAS/SEC14 domain-containing protein [Myxococcota bacterium]